MFDAKLEAIHAAYRDFLQADEIWSKQLQDEFGKQAGDMRYLPAGQALPGHAGFKVTNDRWLRLVQERRENLNV